MDDFIGECASMVLSVDGAARQSEVLSVCQAFLALGDAVWGLPAHEVDIDRLHKACDAAKGVDFGEPLPGELETFASTACAQLVTSLKADGGMNIRLLEAIDSFVCTILTKGHKLDIVVRACRCDMFLGEALSKARGLPKTLQEMSAEEVNQNFPTVKNVRHAGVELEALLDTIGKHDLKELCRHVEQHLDEASIFTDAVKKVILMGTIMQLTAELKMQAQFIGEDCGWGRGRDNKLSWSRYKENAKEKLLPLDGAKLDKGRIALEKFVAIAEKRYEVFDNGMPPSLYEDIAAVVNDSLLLSVEITIMKLILDPDMVKNKEKMRIAVYDAMAKLMKGRGAKEELAGLLPTPLRPKVEAAIKMRPIS